VINSTDYFLYLPLMPQVAGGLIEPRHIRVSLRRRLRTMRFVLGTVIHVDHGQKVVSWTGLAGAAGQVGYDRLILTVGTVDKLLPIPDLADYARVPDHRRGHVPPRPHHPPARTGLGRHGPPGAPDPGPASRWSARAIPAPRSRRTVSC
jgi:hypothetical protein